MEQNTFADGSPFHFSFASVALPQLKPDDHPRRFTGVFDYLMQ
jgi:hypothetical protein